MTPHSDPSAFTEDERRPRITVRSVSQRFGERTVLDAINLEVPAGETLAILGDSGCGKTTLLRAMAGLLEPDAGQIFLDGVDLGGCSLQNRGILYLSQEALLFEHLDCFDNVAFALRLRKVSETVVQERVAQMLAATGLTGSKQKRSWQLSGGEKQRAAFARAILAEPRVLLLDEPFGSLDNATRGQMQQLFRRLAHRFGMTALFVTHDLKEALLVGDRFAILRAGRLTPFPDRAAFVRDEATGVGREIGFWQTIAEEREPSVHPKSRS